MENITAAERNKMALMYGLITGIIYLVITTAVNILVGSMITFYAAKFVGFVLYFVIIGIFAARIRKANGGYIEFRELFGAIFIMLLIAGLMSYLYNYLYIEVIDPQFMNKIRTATVHFMENMKTPEDKIDDALRKFDEKVAESKTFHFGAALLTFLEALVVDCLFGLIVCLIVKKSKPVFNN